MPTMVEIDYDDDGARRGRKIDPVELWFNGSQWYLRAHDLENAGEMTFFAMAGIHQWKDAP
jgi:predicted DNA-binding transcriptional regulator YafY